MLLRGDVCSVAMLDVLLEVLVPPYPAAEARAEAGAGPGTDTGAGSDGDSGRTDAEWWRPPKRTQEHGAVACETQAHSVQPASVYWAGLMKAALTRRSVVDYDFGDDNGDGHGANGGCNAPRAAVDAAAGSWADSGPGSAAVARLNLGAAAGAGDSEASVWEHERAQAVAHARSQPLWQCMLPQIVTECTAVPGSPMTMPPLGLLLRGARAAPPVAVRFGMQETMVSTPLPGLVLPPSVQRLREAGVRPNGVCALCCSTEATPDELVPADAANGFGSLLLNSCSAAAGGCRGLRLRADVRAAARLQRIIAGVTRAHRNPFIARQQLFAPPSDAVLYAGEVAREGPWPEEWLSARAVVLPTCGLLLLGALRGDGALLRSHLLQFAQRGTILDPSEARIKPLWLDSLCAGTGAARQAFRWRVALALARALPEDGGTAGVRDDSVSGSGSSAGGGSSEDVVAQLGDTSRYSCCSALLCVLAEDAAEHQAAPPPRFTLSAVKPVTEMRHLGAVITAYYSAPTDSRITTVSDQRLRARVIRRVFADALSAGLREGAGAVEWGAPVAPDLVLSRVLNGQPGVAKKLSPLEHMMRTWAKGELPHVECVALLLAHGAEYHVRADRVPIVVDNRYLNNPMVGTVTVLHCMARLAKALHPSSVPAGDAMRRVIEAVCDGEETRSRIRLAIANARR